MRKGKAAANMSATLVALPQMDIAQLRQHYARCYGTDAPISFSRQLLTYAVAYQLQAQAMGGLSAVLRKKLLSIASTKADTHIKRIPTMIAGTRLVREWRGVVHEVQILEDGVLWNGQKHRSLSVVACAITGTHCSGPRFFGLRRAS